MLFLLSDKGKNHGNGNILIQSPAGATICRRHPNIILSMLKIMPSLKIRSASGGPQTAQAGYVSGSV
jgi:hypothetical protein